jgi:hypothetical protein
LRKDEFGGNTIDDITIVSQNVTETKDLFGSVGQVGVIIIIFLFV